MSRIIIYAEDGVTIEDECGGGLWSGRCPRAQDDSPIACAGRRIALAATFGHVLPLKVEDKAIICPLTALGICGDFIGRPSEHPSSKEAVTADTKRSSTEGCRT